MKTLGKYEILEELGRGGFAVVYKARDPDLDRVVALKVLAPHLTWDPTFAQRFRQEAQATASLRHPNIVVIHEVGEEDEQLYIAMEYLPGPTLAELLEKETIPPEQGQPILEQVAGALDYAHSEGVLHRDVKPSNVMVTESKQGQLHATLTDFGLVKALESSKSLTSMGTILGSPEYMAPEQADPERLDEIGPATDLYALGVVAYEMLVGRLPFPGSTPSTLVAHIQNAPPDPQGLRQDLPDGVAGVLLKALSKRGEDRYASAGELAQALQDSLETSQAAQQREEELLDLYGQVQTAIEAEDWATAETACRQILALDADYRDVPELWTEIRSARARQQELERLYQAAQTAAASGAWAEVVDLCGEIEALEPDYRDVGLLLARAEDGLRAEQVQEEQLDSLYQQAQDALQGQRWQDASRFAAAILALKPGYRDAEALLAEAQEVQRREQPGEAPPPRPAEPLQGAPAEEPAPAPPLAAAAPAAEPIPAKERRRIPIYAWALGGIVAVALLIIGLLAAEGAATSRRQAEAAAMARAVLRAETRGAATAEARGATTAEAQGFATAEALFAATAKAFDIAMIEVWGTVTAEARGAATARARIAVTAEARGAATARAQGAATAEVRDAATAEALDAAEAATRAAATSAARATAAAQAQAAATSAVQATAQALGVPAGWEAVIWETFEDDTRFRTGDYETDRSTGNRRLDGGVYRWEATAKEGFHSRTTPSEQSASSDFFLTVEARQAGGPKEAEFGVSFRQDDAGYYSFRISEHQQFEVSSWDWGAEAWTTLIPWTDSSAIRPGEANHLTVVGRGSHFDFFVNGEKVGEMDDASYSEGKVALALELSKGMSGVFEFDNFALYTP